MPLISSDTDSAGSRSSVPHATSSRLLAGPIPLATARVWLTAAGPLRFAGEPSLCRPRRHRVTRAVLRDLRNRLDQLAVNTARGAEIAAAAPTRSYWVIPELVAEVRFTEWTRDRRRRHPVFLCLREDKKGPEVVLDPAVGTALDRTAGDKEVSALRPKHQTLRSK